jgi:hypothetical protein
MGLFQHQIICVLIQIFSKTIRKMTRRGKFLTNEKWSKYWNDTKYEQIRTYLKDMFKDLLFVDKTHQYYLHGKNLYSVSAVTSWYKPKFDSDSKAKEMYEKGMKFFRSTSGVWLTDSVPVEYLEEISL